MTTDESSTGKADVDDLDVRIVRGSPTEEELAAILAVLHALPAPPTHRRAAEPESPSAWQLTQRPLRTAPLRRPWR